METLEKIKVTVEVKVNAPIEKVWDRFTGPNHIINWNNASDDWHTPRAENDLREGGRFVSRMEARDGSSGFDFSGKYVKVLPHKHIEYIMEDGRRVKIDFSAKHGITTLTETFETEQTNSVELQREGWQAILDNFKRYVEQ